MFILMLLAFMALSFFVSNKLKRKFRQYSQTPLSSGFSGKEIAERMLHNNGIYDVQVISVPGKLTDHYDPSKKTVNLSQEVYHGRNIAAAAVAAHECGHAIQHQQAYSWLSFRTAMVPVTIASSKIMNAIFLLGIFGSFMLNLNWVYIMYVVIAAQAIITAFSLVTLPVEFDASKRALVWLKSDNIANNTEMEQAEDALNWAARTYLVSALAAITTLLFYILRMAGDE